MSAFAPVPGRRSDSRGVGVRTPSERIAGYDLARAVALLGMAGLHFVGIMTDFLKRRLTLTDDFERFFLGVHDALSGRFAALFVVLAGAGVSLLTRRARLSNDPALLDGAKRTLRRRAWFLLFAGVALSHVWVTEILHFYAVYLALACFFLRARGLKIWAAIIGCVAASVALHCVAKYNAPDFAWDASLRLIRGDKYGFWNGGLNFEMGIPVHPETNVDSLPDALKELFFNGAHPVFPWLSFFLLGLWLGNIEIHRKAKYVALPLALVFIYAAEGLSAWMLPAAVRNEFNPPFQRLLFSRDVFPPMPLFALSAGASATAILCACLMLGEAAGRWLPLRWLSALGQMSLSFYVGHILLGMGWLYWTDSLENRSPEAAIAFAIMFCFLCVLLAAAWKRFVHERGPLEWLMRRLAG